MKRVTVVVTLHGSKTRRPRRDPWSRWGFRAPSVPESDTSAPLCRPATRSAAGSARARICGASAGSAGAALLGLVLGGGRTGLVRIDAQHNLHLLLDLRHHDRVVLEIHLRVLAALADLLTVVAVPGPRLLDDVRLGTDV